MAIAYDIPNVIDKIAATIINQIIKRFICSPYSKHNPAYPIIIANGIVKISNNNHNGENIFAITIGTITSATATINNIMSIIPRIL